MEVRFDQLFIFLLIILFSLADLFIRWMRKRSGQAPPADVEQEAEDVAKREAPEPEPGWRERAAEPSAVPEHVPLAIRPAAAAQPRQLPSPKPPRPRRKVSPARARLTPRDARRGIVLMTVLGPCRGLGVRELP